MDYYVIDLDGPNYRFLANLAKVVADLTDQSIDDLDVPDDEWGLNLTDWGLKDRTEFLIAYSLGVRYGDLLWEGEPADGAVQGWADLAARPDSYIHVVTARTPFGSEAEAAEATNYWLAMNGLYYDHISFAHDKVPTVRNHIAFLDLDESDLRIMTIDDRASNCQEFATAGWESYVYAFPSNTHLDLPRVSSMIEFAEITKS